MAAEFVRARCAETGHVAALPKAALQAGMLSGWVEVDGPVPTRPKVAAFRAGDKPDTDTADTDTADTAAGDEEESADTTSAEEKE